MNHSCLSMSSRLSRLNLQSKPFKASHFLFSFFFLLHAASSSNVTWNLKPNPKSSSIITNNKNLVTEIYLRVMLLMCQTEQKTSSLSHNSIAP